MKKAIILTLLFCVIFMTINAQSSDKEYSEKVQSLESTISNLYVVISGEKGEERDWELMHYLFHPDAKLIPSGKSKDGIYKARYMSVQDYIDSSGKWLVENGFFEKEIHRSVNTFGNITQVFSTYEAFKSKAGKTPFMRGINSIQIIK